MILRYDVHDSRPGGSASLQTTQCTKRSTVLNRTSLSLLLTSVPGRLMELRGHMAHATCCKQGRRGCKDKFKVDNNNNNNKKGKNTVHML